MSVFVFMTHFCLEDFATIVQMGPLAVATSCTLPLRFAIKQHDFWPEAQTAPISISIPALSEGFHLVLI